jgi:phage internal scaffolding protein
MGMLTAKVRRDPLIFPDQGVTKQSHKDECDVNQILARYERTGVVTHLAKGIPQFADVSQIGDYHSALEQVRQADEFFMGLPAKVRSAFDNDPALLLDAVHDPAQRDKLEKLGLLEIIPVKDVDSGSDATGVAATPPQSGSGSSEAAGGASDA